MRLIRNDSEMTYEAFYSAYYSRILKYLTGKCARPQDAEDLTSQVFLYCYQNFSSYCSSKASMASWVYMIANSRFKNYCRDRKVFSDIDEIAEFLPDEQNSVDSALMLDEMRDQIALALLKLSERQRIIVVLSYFKNMSAAEIGRQLDMSPGNVRVQLSRALKKLEEELEELR
ncbi:MAG: RNA polymerase sigma factor [Aristaeellaceae bacterium]